MGQLLHDELVWLLVPLVLHNQSHFLNELVEVSVLYEFYQHWRLACLSEDELSKLVGLAMCHPWYVTREQLLHGLQQEDFVGVLTRVETLLGLDRDLE